MWYNALAKITKTKGDCQVGVSTIFFYLLMAGVVVFLIFTVACVVESLTKNSGVQRVENRKRQSRVDEDVDIDSMLERLERKTIRKTSEATIEQKPEPKIERVFRSPEPEKVYVEKQNIETKKQEEPEVDFDAIFTKLENDFNASKNKEDEEKKRLEEQKAEEERVRIEKEIVAEEEKKALDALFAEEKDEEKSFEEQTENTSIQKLFAKSQFDTNEEKEESSVVQIPVIEEKKELSQFDYQARYDVLNLALEKCKKDLQKATREVSKYEKTEKRKARNEKLLDKKAGELTNLNLVLYNVNDIKEIDPVKKEKQEALTQHISDLKETIADATEYLAKNKEKYKNAVKIQEFLTKEKDRQED